jgi:hypothetical protein
MGRLQGAQFRTVPLGEVASDLRNLAQIDARVLGVSHEKHHKYLINDSETRGVGLWAGDDCVGYAYVSTGGHIGPLAVTKPNAVDAAFRTALTLAAESGSSQVSAFVPGTSETALRTAVEHGMRITIADVVDVNTGFGDGPGICPAILASCSWK